MIQNILFFTLGFLCAGFLALLIAPAVWSRAAMLTRKRVEASVPLSLNEIQADKDRLRAEFAMSTRRLEMSIKSLREKAAGQSLEINRYREEVNRLLDERTAQDEVVAGLEARVEDLESNLQAREEELDDTWARLAGAEATLKERALELKELGRLYDDASFSSSSRQIELVARETEIEKLSNDISELRDQRKQAERRLREIAAESKTAQDELKLEKRKSADLEGRLERLMTNLSDLEDKLHRREKELERLRGPESAKNPRSEAAPRENDDAEATDLMPVASRLLSDRVDAGTKQAMDKLDADRERLEARLKTLMQENRRLREQAGAAGRSKQQAGVEEQRESALLREQINDIAAEVVNLTIKLEGPGSTIRKALDQPVEGPGPAQAGLSLADRVRALQQAGANGSA